MLHFLRQDMIILYDPNYPRTQKVKALEDGNPICYIIENSTCYEVLGKKFELPSI